MVSWVVHIRSIEADFLTYHDWTGPKLVLPQIFKSTLRKRKTNSFHYFYEKYNSVDLLRVVNYLFVGDGCPC